jgi:hypothetical protein
MVRQLALAYGLVSYLLFLASFLYTIGFVGNVFVPKSIDAPVVEASWYRSLAVDTALLLLFAVPHSVMARIVVGRVVMLRLRSVATVPCFLCGRDCRCTGDNDASSREPASQKSSSGRLFFHFSLLAGSDRSGASTPNSTSLCLGNGNRHERTGSCGCRGSKPAPFFGIGGPLGTLFRQSA